MKRYVVPPAAAAKGDQSAEIRRLKQELLRATEGRDILKSHRVFRQGCKMKYAFIKGHHQQFGVRSMCNMLTVHPSGLYAWLKRPFSKRTLEDERQTQLLKEAWEDSGKVYGYPFADR